MLKEFKDFALKGNLIDTAVAFIMGIAFGKVTTAFVEKMFAPLVGLLLGGVDLSKQKTVIKPAIAEVKDASGAVITPGAAEVAVEWGLFVTSCIDFIIVAFVMFMVVKLMNSLKKKEAELPALPQEPTTEEKLLMEIRDALKK